MTDFEKKLIDPPEKYRPIPFWSWNEKLQTEETRRQIRVMKEAGFGGFFMHARGGLQTEYLSDEWFENVAASIDEGQKLDMSAWGYDENGWPSGSGNGKVTALGIDYQQKYLRCKKTEAPFTDGQTLSNVEVDGVVYHCYFEVNPYYIDTMNPEVVGEFLKSTHEEYLQNLKDGFKMMEGFFTDEPQASRNGFPWSFNLENEYKRIYNEDIKDHLPKLFYRLEGFEEFRFRFWKLVRDLFSDSYMGVIGSWCRKNGVRLTGHMVLEEDYYEHILANGSCMPSYEFMDIPGMDHIGRELPSVQTEMQLASAAHQLGKKQILSETFAACGWNISLEDMRRIYEHQMVHGVNLLCQHLEGYSLRGIRKRDYPASIFSQQPWWDDYKIFNDMVSRIGMLLGEGRVPFNILVLSTIESGWLLTDDRAETDKYAKKLLEVMNCLEDAHLYYHLGESRIINRYGSIKGGRFIVGGQSYSAVIVPDSKCLDKTVFEMLCEHKKQGGTVVFCNEIPQYLDGIKTQKVTDFASDCITAASDKIPDVLPYECKILSLSLRDKSQTGSIRSTVRRFDDKKMTMCYICNFGDEKSSITVEIAGKSAACFDYLSGKILPACFENIGDKVKITSDIHPNSSAIFFVYDNEEFAPAKQCEDIKTDISDKLKGEWRISGLDDNSLTLDYCDLFVDGKPLLTGIPVSDVQETLCSYRKPVNVRVDFRFNVR
ncbi:MAG: hypothetical protein IKI68_03605, partial [Clostridia bacterium]|nr:hypothetical protein [Clostridia bacterium]